MFSCARLQINFSTKECDIVGEMGCFSDFLLFVSIGINQETTIATKKQESKIHIIS